MIKLNFLTTKLKHTLFFTLEAPDQELTTKKGHTLSFENNYSELDRKSKQKLTKFFFEVSPKLARHYNNNKFLFDTAHKCVVTTSNDPVIFSSV